MIENVVKLVDGALKNHTDPQLKTQLLIMIDGIRHDSDDWWVVPVYPEIEVPNLYDLYNSLAMAEEELEGSGLKIQLVPAHALAAVH